MKKYTRAQMPPLDERQLAFSLQASRKAFIFMLMVLWLQLVFGRFFNAVIPKDFMISLAFWGGLIIQSLYTIMTNAHPLVSSGLKSYILPLMVVVCLLTIVVVVFTVWWIMALDNITLIFTKDGPAVMLLIWLGIFADILAIAYCIQKNRQEEDE